MDLSEFDKIVMKNGRKGYVVHGNVAGCVYEVDFRDIINDSDVLPTEVVKVEDIDFAI